MLRRLMEHLETVYIVGMIIGLLIILLGTFLDMTMMFFGVGVLTSTAMLALISGFYELFSIQDA